MITVEHLTKRYGNVLAVDDLSFTIEDGHIYGFLGPNGAGKSTTLNIMTGCLAATSGEVKINDYDIYENEKEAKRQIGYLPEIPPLYVDQTPREYLSFVADAKGVAKADKEAEIEKVIEETHIEDVADRLIKHLSKGYKQRVGIAQALLNNPSVIILDEPTVGLDPMQIIEIRDLIAELGKTHTVILSSHILPEVQAICEKVLIIYKGKLVAFDKPENLSKSLSSGAAIEIVAEASADEIKNIVDSISSIIRYEVKDESEGKTTVMLYTDAENTHDTCQELFAKFADAKKILLQMNPIKTTLEDIFIELTSTNDEPEDQAEKLEEFFTDDAEAETERIETEEGESTDESESEVDE